MRWLQQQKYLKEAYELYGEVSLLFSQPRTYLTRRQDFHIVKMPLLSEEVDRKSVV